ncbi:fluoride efflux transporter CrcB [Anaerocolumna sp. MB42-C2]|uniref:fluoride efflux transporter CrcB n=1 Tax=Anaerocolumna sp. MB42-C2 TaxID=3070997 RepID=UPI0027DF5B68|nr:fluoride efflux transporter CrcB [Anaerocolumna sp. MB42-C2]WMJ86396.1 fluoride efflux transporter CrcB [Anaerocolumna sp. MB42-C2]
MELIFVGLGGALGSLTRYQAGKIISGKYSIAFPIGTFMINITGAILLGIISSMDAGKNIYLLFGDGFLGAYTTFSTFMYEGFQLFQKNKKLNAFTYIISSLVLGILGYGIGYCLI